MSLIDNLKSILGSLLNVEKLGVSILSNNSINNNQYHIHLDDTFKGTVSTDGKKITVNPDALPPVEKAKFLQFLKKDMFLDCEYLITGTDENMLEMAEEIVAKEIARFKVLEKVIPRDDYHALKAALVIRELHRQGKPVEDHKENVFRVYGERGRKICNICTAGYFEGILELYAACGENKDDFLQRYNIIIAESAFSIFVHAWKDNDALKKSILDRLAANKRYGNHYVNIHALGKQNIKTAEAVVREITVSNPLIDISQHFKSGDTLFIRLEETTEMF